MTVELAICVVGVALGVLTALLIRLQIEVNDCHKSLRRARRDVVDHEARLRHAVSALRLLYDQINQVRGHLLDHQHTVFIVRDQNQDDADADSWKNGNGL